MNPWETWKKGFDTWENTTAQYLEGVMQKPTLLEPAGAMLTMAMKTKAAFDDAAARWWGAWGLPTKRDQERLLHLVNSLQSKVLDLEEQLADKKGN